MKLWKLKLEWQQEEMGSFLVEKELEVGRSKDCQVVLEHPTVSRKHARFTVEGGVLFVEDLGSANGTFVDGKKIVKEKLTEGEIVQIGVYSFTVIALADEKQESPPAEGTTFMKVPLAPEAPKPAEPMPKEAEAERTVTSYGVEEAIGFYFLIGVKDREARFALKGESLSIGRSPDSDISLEDLSVSRNHARITKTEDGWKVEDLGSANGTFINGEKIEEGVLKPNDILKIGNVELKLIAPGEVLAVEFSKLGKGELAAPVKTSIFAQKRVRIVALAVGVLIALLVVIKFTIIPTPPPQTAQTGGVISIDEIRARAKECLSTKKWEAAIELSEQILSKMSDDSEAMQIKKEAQKEKTNEEQLAQAKILIEAGKSKEAFSLLDLIPSESAYSKETTEIRENYVSTKLKEAELYESQKDYNAAVQNLQEVIILNPALSAELAEKIAALEKKLKGASKAGKKEKRYTYVKPAAPGSGKESVPSVKEKPPSTEVPPPKMPPSETACDEYCQAMKSYTQGKLDEAMSILRKGAQNSANLQKFEQAIKIIEQIGSNMKQALNYYQAGNKAEAFSMWQEVVRMEKQLDLKGEKSAVYRQIASYIIDESVQKGFEHLQKQEYKKALQYFRHASSLDPQNVQSQKGLSQLAAAAKNIYEEAYMLETVDLKAAIERWQLLLEILPPENEYYQKAKRKLDSYKY